MRLLDSLEFGMSGDDHDRNRFASKRRGVSDYITKPIVDLDALCETVRRNLTG